MASLHADGFGRAICGVLLGAAILGGWAAWLFSSRVPRYETTDSARLEVDLATHVIQAPYSGRVITTGLVLGRGVHAGDVLVELDAAGERLQIEEERARRNVVDPQLDSLRGEVEATQEARDRERETERSAFEEARARLREAEAQAEFAATDVNRYKELYEQGLGSEREYARVQSEARRAAANVEGLQQTGERLEREQRTRESDREAQVRRLETEIRRLEGEKTARSAAIDRLTYDLEKRIIRAAADGKLGEVVTLRPGAVVQQGDKLGSIVPSGKVRIVAEFQPAALGRIRPGQPARLRLQGFPWIQYGSIAAHVATVAEELRDGKVRVECDLASGVPAVIPTQHGQPGTLEVEVERISPARLALRSAGDLVSASRSSTPETP
jgi:membrane fusion protein (multidrug efflux system)